MVKKISPLEGPTLKKIMNKIVLNTEIDMAKHVKSWANLEDISI